MLKYKSNLNIFFKGGYLENNILPLITDIPEDMSVGDVDAWEVIHEDEEYNLSFFKSYDPQIDFYMLLQKDKDGIIFFGEDWKKDCVNYLKENNLSALANRLGLVHD
jgi:hypothetical protein